MKRSQISTFIILGVVILIFVFFITFIYSLFSEPDAFGDTNIEQSNVDELRASLQSCLEYESELAIFNLGLQGGNIYPDQGGYNELSFTLPYTIDGETRYVGYGIERSGSEPIAPLYPAGIAAKQGNYYTLSYLETNFARNRLWGENTFRKLCDSNGANSVNNPDKGLSCEIFTYDADDSIQSDLEGVLKNNIDLCVNRQSRDFNERVGGFEYNISDVEVVIGYEEVQITAQANVIVSQERITSKFDDLTYTIPVRLKKVYNLMYYMLERETRDVRFDKSVDFIQIVDCNYNSTTRCWDSDMLVNVIRSPNGFYIGDDILEIVDTDSNVLGNPFRFIVAIGNRPPMLDFIDKDTSDLSPNMVLTIGDYTNITPFAYDPDEDELTFFYTANSDWVDTNSLQNSNLYQSGVGCSQSSQCASLASNQTGTYELEVLVRDDSLLYDYQDIFVKSYGSGSSAGGWYEDVDICPASRVGYDTKICTGDNCVCNTGEYCIDANPTRDTQMTCEEGSYCCSSKTNGDVVILCDEKDAFCDVNSDSGTIEISCTGEDVTCRAESSGTIKQLCQGSGVVCQMTGNFIDSLVGNCPAVTTSCTSFGSWS